MTVVEIIYAVAAGLSGLAAVLAWLAKIGWAKEFRAAKEAEISALNGQIVALKDAKEAEVSAVRAHVSALEAQIAGLEKFLPADVWHQYDHLKKFLQEASDSLRERDQILEQKQLEITLLTEQNAALTDENSSAAKVLEQMAQQMGGLRDSIQLQLKDTEQQIDLLNERIGSGEMRLPSLRISGTGTVDPTFMVEAERMKGNPRTEK